MEINEKNELGKTALKLKGKWYSIKNGKQVFAHNWEISPIATIELYDGKYVLVGTDKIFPKEEVSRLENNTTELDIPLLTCSEIYSRKTG